MMTEEIDDEYPRMLYSNNAVITVRDGEQEAAMGSDWSRTPPGDYVNSARRLSIIHHQMSDTEELVELIMTRIRKEIVPLINGRDEIREEPVPFRRGPGRPPKHHIV